ncbi:MAG: hypothetical protein ACPLRM_06380 [Anaerolineae bacterium]
MKWRYHALCLLLFVSASALGACNKFIPAPTATPTQTAVQPTPTESNIAAPIEVRNARDAVLSYLREHYSANAPAAGLSWSEERATPPGLVGAETYRYTSGDWVITISYPVTSPNMVLYQVVATNSATGFQWLGVADGAGNIKTPATEVSDPVLAARDAVLKYLGERYNVQIPLAELTWARTRLTPEGLVGAETYQYRAGDWVVTISYPVVPPAQVTYQVSVSNESISFQWQGEVGANGEIRESTGPAGGQPVVAWFGRVIGLPTDAQFDDYLALEPKGTGEVGLRGANPAIESQLKELRTLGVCAHFWGTLTCGVSDYGGCQLLVTRIRREDEEIPSTPDAVERWEGKITSAAATAEYDDCFILAGDFPMHYGIDSNDPALSIQLQSLRDSDTTIRIWGQLTCGITDANRSRINVSAIEVLGSAPQPTPMVVEGWIGKIIPLEPGSPYDDCFERDDGQRYGIQAQDAKLAARLETLRTEGVRVRIWGQIAYDVSDVEGRQILVTEIETVE